jgi:hypothetical protein
MTSVPRDSLPHTGLGQLVAHVGNNLHLLVSSNQSSGGAEQRLDVGDWAEVPELVGIEDRADACDLTACDAYREQRYMPSFEARV